MGVDFNQSAGNVPEQSAQSRRAVICPDHLIPNVASAVSRPARRARSRNRRAHGSITRWDQFDDVGSTRASGATGSNGVLTDLDSVFVAERKKECRL